MAPDNSLNKLDEFLSTLDQEEMDQVARLVVSHDTKQWLEHQQKMFQLRMWGVAVVVTLALFALAFLVSMFSDRRADPALMQVLATAFTAIVGSAGTQTLITIASNQKAKYEAKKQIGKCETDK